ncbi:MAG: hypothetical protein RIS66_252 [Actinomycetota bacterium]|jgi:hypothetical protein
MKSLPKVIFGSLAIVFFAIGLAYLPFFVWIGDGQGSNPLLGLLIGIASVLIPWAISYWFARLALKAKR